MDTAITLSGLLGADPELATTSTGRPKARFRVAVTRREVRDGQWRDVDTTWMQVEAWNQLAQNVAASLRRGDPVVVSGVLRTSRWTDERGTRHDRLHVTAQHVGHDLAFGVSTFSRASGPGRGGGDPAPAPEGGNGPVVAPADAESPRPVGTVPPADGDRDMGGDHGAGGADAAAGDDGAGGGRDGDADAPAAVGVPPGSSAGTAG